MLNILKNKTMTEEIKFLNEIERRFNKALDDKFESHEKLQDTKWCNANDVHEKILTKQIETNGRVSKLEKWRWGLGGAITLLGVLFSVFGLFIINKLI